MWSSTTAAEYAAAQHAPGHLARFLGRITRRILVVKPEWEDHLASSEAATIARKRPRQEVSLSNHKRPKASRKGPRPPTLAKAKKDLAQGRLPLEEWREAWKRLSNPSWGIQVPHWDQGGALDEAAALQSLSMNTTTQNRRLVSWEHLWEGLRTGSLRESLEEERHKSFYGGLRQVPIDLWSVLRALRELARPLPQLYNQPLLVAVPILSPGSATGGETERILSLGIYAHRLLFEIMTTSHLEVVLAALDPASYQVKRPLVSPAPSLRKAPIFQSADWPQVRMGTAPPFQQPIRSEEKKTPESVVERKDCSRSEDYLDAFSTDGFLKLLEHPGLDLAGVEGWPALEEGLQVSSKSQPQDGLQVHLLPHQIHGVCWMYLMEGLRSKGGLNALLWEERWFPEGHDSYFYSPALGQLRLKLQAYDHEDNHTTASAEPEDVAGGILSDEMGESSSVCGNLRPQSCVTAPFLTLLVRCFFLCLLGFVVPLVGVQDSARRSKLWR